MITEKVRKAVHIGGYNYLIGKLVHKILTPFTRLIPSTISKKIEFFLLVGYWPNFTNPKSFNEKLSARKLITPHPMSRVLADKYAVREYVAKKGYEQILTRLYWHGNQVSLIPYNTLPKKYVIKATHGSGWNILVENKEMIIIDEVNSLCNKWLKSRYSSTLGETHYDSIEPKILIEEFLEDIQYGIPLDYKFLCFDGKVMYIQVDSDRFSEHKRNIYDTHWVYQDVMYNFPNSRVVDKPVYLKEMIQIAEDLSEGIDFCRVDLYLKDGKTIYFGEITMTPEGALGRFNPLSWDLKMGSHWRLT